MLLRNDCPSSRFGTGTVSSTMANRWPKTSLDLEPDLDVAGSQIAGEDEWDGVRVLAVGGQFEPVAEGLEEMIVADHLAGHLEAVVFAVLEALAAGGRRRHQDQTMAHGAGLVPAREFPLRLDVEAGRGGRDLGGEGGEGGEPLLRRLGRCGDVLDDGGAGKVVLQGAGRPTQPFVGAQHGDVRAGQAAARRRPARGALMPEVVGPVPARGQEDDHKVARRAVAAAVEPDLQLAAAREAVRGGAPIGQGEPTRRAVQKVEEGAGVVERAPLTECRVHAVLPEHLEFVQRRSGVRVAGLPEGLDERLAPVVLGKVDEELPLLFADQRPDALEPAHEAGIESRRGGIPAPSRRPAGCCRRKPAATRRKRRRSCSVSVPRAAPLAHPPSNSDHDRQREHRGREGKILPQPGAGAQVADDHLIDPAQKQEGRGDQQRRVVLPQQNGAPTEARLGRSPQAGTGPERRRALGPSGDG